MNRALYSDTDSSSGYMTNKSNYSDIRSQYSSSRASSNLNPVGGGHSQGAYLNLPYPPRGQRDSVSNVGSIPPPPPPGSASIYSQPPPPPPAVPPPSLVDLSANARESRGSAFELYRKPGDLSNSGSPLRSLVGPSNGYFHGLPPPPPPMLETK